jgi:Ca2+-binding RTX toxin-like protein
LANGFGALGKNTFPYMDPMNPPFEYPTTRDEGLKIPYPHPEFNVPEQPLTDNMRRYEKSLISWDSLSNLTMQDMMDRLKGLFDEAMGASSPLILDLDGDGAETLGQSAYIQFDHDCNGFAELTGWVGPDDGLLVLDRNGNGQIDNGSELFGNNSGTGTGWANGFDALAEFDSNLDGSINASDTAFASLRVWKDANSNGFVDTNELLTLQQAGVGSLSLSYTNGTAVDAQGNSHLQLGSYTTTQGQTRQMTDVWFSVDTMRSLDLNLVEVPDDVRALPDIDGSGTVHSLHQAMARDTSGALKALIIAYSGAITDAARAALLPDILYHWTGAQDVDPASRGGNIDARKLTALEGFMGRGYQPYGGGVAGPDAASLLVSAFDELVAYVGVTLDAQTNLKTYYNLVKYTWNDATATTEFDVAPLVQRLSEIYATDPEEAVAVMTRLGAGLWEAGSDIGRGVSEAIRNSGNPAVAGFARELATLGLHYLAGDENSNTLTAPFDKGSMVLGHGGGDVIYGSSRNDSLDGGAGDDTLSGGAGADILVGGTGADSLDGGAGDNTYRFGRGDGADVISAVDEWATKKNVLELKEGVAQADLRAARVGDSLVLSIAGTADSVTLDKYFNGDNYRPVQMMRLSTGAVVNMDSLIQQTFGGSAAADVMLGTALADVMTGLAGADTLSGEGDNDRLDGGADDDLLSGGDGADSLTGGLGDDQLSGDVGDDTLDGGAGVDQLNGGSGNNTYRFGHGDGADVIWARDYTATKNNVLQFKAGVAKADLRAARVGNSLVLSIAGTADSVTLDHYFDWDSVCRSVQEVRLSTGAVISADVIAQMTFRRFGGGRHDGRHGAGRCDDGAVGGGHALWQWWQWWQ